MVLALTGGDVAPPRDASSYGRMLPPCPTGLRDCALANEMSAEAMRVSFVCTSPLPATKAAVFQVDTCQHSSIERGLHGTELRVNCDVYMA